MRRLAATIAASLVVLAVLGRPRSLRQEADLLALVPADALLHVVADGVAPLRAALVAQVDAVVPGLGATLAGGMLPAILAAPGIDDRRPIALSILSSGAKLIALPMRDPAAAERLDVTALGAGTRVVSADRYALVATEGAPSLEELRRGAVAPPPSLGGHVRGFINVSLATHSDEVRKLRELERKQLPEGTRGATDALEQLGTVVPRIDFGLSLSAAGTELQAAFAPLRDGVLGTVARAAVPAGPNRFLAAVPAGSSLVVVARANDPLSSALDSAFQSALQSMPGEGDVPEDKKALLRRLRRQGRVWSSLTGSDIAAAVRWGTDPSSISLVHAFGCRDVRKMRRLLRKTWEPGMRVLAFKPRASTIDGVEIDELSVQAEAFTPPPGAGDAAARAAASMAHLYAEPIRYGFPPGAAIMTVGRDGEARMREALAALRAGVVQSALERAFAPGALLGVAVDAAAVVRLMTRSEPGDEGSRAEPPPDYLALSIVPRQGVIVVHVRVPSEALRMLVPTWSPAAPFPHCPAGGVTGTGC